MRSSANHTRRALALVLLLSASIALAGHAGVAGAADEEPQIPPEGDAESPDPASADPSDSDEPMLEAVADGLGITLDQAAERVAREDVNIERGRRLAEGLRGRSGGFYLDENGDLVVTTTDAAGDAEVKKGRGRPERVEHNSARLEAIVERLERHVDKHGGGAVLGLYIDVQTNSVVVEVTEGADDSETGELLKVAGRFGTAVRVEHLEKELQPETAGDWSVGGYGYDADRTYNGLAPDCSIGFNAKTTAGYPVMITAGHCVDGKVNQWTTRNGYWFGQVRSDHFPGDDFGTVWNQYSYYFQPSPSVYTWYGNSATSVAADRYISVRGYTNHHVPGSIVCKSGITTGYTCGIIRSSYQNVQLDGRWVYGLVRHTACVQKGDSGGANITTSGLALGVTSGASLDRYERCLVNVGQENVSWYQPIGEVLQREGLTLLTSN